MKSSKDGKMRNNDKGSELVSNTNRLKLRTQDGKMSETYVLDKLS